MSIQASETKRDPYLLIWAQIMLDELFGGNMKATDEWLERKEHLSNDNLKTAVEDACNLR